MQRALYTVLTVCAGVAGCCIASEHNAQSQGIMVHDIYRVGKPTIQRIEHIAGTLHYLQRQYRQIATQFQEVRDTASALRGMPISQLLENAMAYMGSTSGVTGAMSSHIDAWLTFIAQSSHIHDVYEAAREIGALESSDMRDICQHFELGRLVRDYHMLYQEFQGVQKDALTLRDSGDLGTLFQRLQEAQPLRDNHALLSNLHTMARTSLQIVTQADSLADLFQADRTERIQQELTRFETMHVVFPLDRVLVPGIVSMAESLVDAS